MPFAGFPAASTPNAALLIAEGVQPLPVPDVEPLDTTNVYEDEDGYEVIEQQPIYQPTPPTSSKPKYGKTSSSCSSYLTVSLLPPAVDFASGSGHKRKNPRSSKKLDYWQVDDPTGRHFHVHKDGTVTWRD
ncbi:hypothetical protein B0T17DRAFT_510104 [Bombardia bombarda]|uniref:Uncharacterized protein n=1 Tax=Bombardia bombarda TaxID=252184 RepID=A0AA39WNB7_9PEZI|nr:hypothetical protein B0T17DRAFT_510104 [Bombardia bombarda]